MLIGKCSKLISLYCDVKNILLWLASPLQVSAIYLFCPSDHDDDEDEEALVLMSWAPYDVGFNSDLGVNDNYDDQDGGDDY